MLVPDIAGWMLSTLEIRFEGIMYEIRNILRPTRKRLDARIFAEISVAQ